MKCFRTGLKRLTAMMALAATLGGAAFAEQPVEGQLDAYVVVRNADGSEARERARDIAPGEVIEYELVYTNVSDGALAGFTLNGDVPASTTYVAGSATMSDAAQFEVYVADIGWSGEPVLRETVDANGETVATTVQPEEYGAVRWRLSEVLTPEQSVTARYRVAVTD